MSSETLMRQPRPTPGPSRGYRVLRFDCPALSNKLRLVVAPIQRLPIVTVLAVVDAGALWDPKRREGTAPLTAKLLLEGAGELDGAELTDRFEEHGATIESRAELVASVLSMTGMRGHI